MKYKPIALLLVVLALASGCHKPSTRLNPQIQFCEDIVMNLPTPDNIDPDRTKNMLADRAATLWPPLAKGSREYDVFHSVYDEYISYECGVWQDRWDINRESGYVHDMGYDYQYQVSHMKTYTDEKNAEMLREYQLVKDKARDAAAILRQIQASE